MTLRRSQVRQKMSRIIDEIGAALFAAGAEEISFQLKKEPEGLRLLVLADYTPENRQKLERLSCLLRPEIRDPALAETFWELAGADLESGTSELSLVGQILSDAQITLDHSRIEMNLFVER